MRNHSAILIVLLCVCATVGANVCATGCADENSGGEKTSPAGLEFFEKRVRPLLVARCLNCHSKRAEVEGGLRLDNRAGWQKGGDHGKAILAGDVDGSLLIRAVRYDDESLQMPPAGKLSASEIAILEQWVRIGAPDPRDGTESAVLPSDPVAGRSHWAFQPLRNSAETRPRLKDTSWASSAIDEYVLAKLEQNGLAPAEEADRVTLARRLAFQLTGLPPTAEQLHRFVNDKRPGAVERFVDQRMGSPEFGRRWGRHWLDLARYADSNGLDENFLFREAWRYRNWVLDALNRDITYDRFLLQQLAGDLLPYDSIDQRDQQRLATGFLVVGPKVLLGNNPQERVMDVADEQLDTIGRAVLGQTLGCARCHDHKFDPVPTRDYYALAGIFTSTSVMERRFMLGQQRVMERLTGLGESGDEADGAYEKYYRELPKLKQRLEHAKAALEAVKKKDGAKLQQLAKQHKDAIAAEVTESLGATDATAAADSNDNVTESTVDWEQRQQAQQKHVDSLAQQVAKPPAIPPRAMIPVEEKPNDEHIRLAGRFDRRGEQVPRGFLQVIGANGYTIPADRSGRKQLAEWLVDTESGAGMLAARVLANRIWRHLIGRGLVRTVDNFGRTGELPSHPELLDHLASELIRSNWSVKAVVRQIVLSRTFAMASTYDADNAALDPENVLLWRAHRRRLEPEALRDAMRLLAGELDHNRYDSTVWYLGDQATAVGANKNRRRTDFPSRSVFLPVIRNDLPELFDVFDFADPHATTGMRPDTMVATQGLFLLNDKSLYLAAEAITARALQRSPNGDARQTASQLFQIVLQRKPTQQQSTALVSVFDRAVSMNGSPETDDARGQNGKEADDKAARKHGRARRAWTLVCHALLASSQFQFLD